MKTYYDILGIANNASKDDIRIAYLRLAKKYHPDVSPDGAEKFKEILNAYKQLTNSFLHQKDCEYRYNISASNPTIGNVINVVVDINLNDIYRSYDIDINFKRMERCQDCDSTGLVINHRDFDTKCRNCNGSGFVKEFMSSAFYGMTKCISCNGRGVIFSYETLCKKCIGSGRVQKDCKKTITYNGNLDSIIFEEEGDIGICGGPRGDLIVGFNIKDTNDFKRINKIDIEVFKYLSLYDWFKGKTVEIKDLRGNIHKIEYKYGSSIFTIDNCGIKLEGKTGRFIVKLMPFFPKTIDYSKIENLKFLDINKE